MFAMTRTCCYYVNAGGVMWSLILSVSVVTHERANGRRPNIVRMGKEWPWLIFGVYPDPDVDSGSVIHFH